MRSKRIRPKPTQPPTPPWHDPFEIKHIDTPSLLISMDITMISGELKTAVVRAAEAVRPIIARETLFEKLSGLCVGSCVEQSVHNDRVRAFADALVPPDVVAEADAEFDARCDKLRYSIHLLTANDEDPELAIKAGKEQIADHVAMSYETACTAEVQTELVQQFEAF